MPMRLPLLLLMIRLTLLDISNRQLAIKDEIYRSIMIIYPSILLCLVFDATHVPNNGVKGNFVMVVSQYRHQR